MNTKRLILNVVLVLVLFVGWNASVHLLLKRHPDWAQKPPEQPTTQPAATQPAMTGPAATGPTTAAAVAVAPTPPVAVPPTTGPVTQPAVATGLHADGGPGGDAVTLGSTDHGNPTFPLGVTVDPRGAGLSTVVLNEFFETAKRDQLYSFQQSVPEAADDTLPLAARFVTVDGKDCDLSTVRWGKRARSAESATYGARVLDGRTPVLDLARTYTLAHRDAADGSGGYEVSVRTAIRNLTIRPVAVSLAMNGPTAPSGENTRSEDRRFIVGFDEGDQFIKTGDEFVTSLSAGKPPVDLLEQQKLPVLWVGACNSYFDAIVRPEPAAAGGLKLATAPAVGLGDNTHDAAVTFTTTAATIPAGGTAPFDLHAFFGPKQRALLRNGYYAAFPRKYDSTLVYTSGFCGILTFGWLIDALYGILWFFHKIFFDWGLAIIGLVVLVRTLLHPITKRAQVNMMGMSKMGPEMERIKKKYGDDKAALSKAQWELTKEQGITPILGCLPMLLQTPIWLALWAALQSTFEIRQAGFLRFGGLHLTWIKDLSQPDALLSFAGPVHLLFFTMHGINVLPVLLAGVFYLQQSTQPVPANMTPEQEQQRKMMKFMPLIYPLFFYVSPSGLNLYILTSTTIGIFEGKIVRRHIKEREAAEKSGQIIVDAPPRRGDGGQPPRAGSGGKTPPSKPGWLATKVAEFQARVELLTREAEQRKKNQGRR